MRPLEKRKLPRVNIALPTEIASNSNGGTTILSRTLDVSKGGALLDSPLPLANGEKICLKIDLDMTSLPRIEAEVLRCQPAFWGRRHSVAVKFEENNPALMDIVDLVHHLREGYKENSFRWL